MNIYDIAKLAGVSIATVSRVVNNSPKVSEKTKQKILSIMEQEGYTPNIFARGLLLDSMNTIGIICPDITDLYMAQAVGHLEKLLHQSGYHCILYCSGYEQAEKESYARQVLEKRVDALVLVGSTYAGTGLNDKETDYIREISKEIPVFTVNAFIGGENIYCSYSDDKSAVYDAASNLIKSGRKRILFLTDSHSYSANKKLEGYEAALRDHHQPVIGELKIHIKNDIHFVRDFLLSRRDIEFDSVIATDDGMAVGALKYALARLLKVPDEMSIIGYNNSLLSICATPEITSIDNRVEKLCMDTVNHIIAILQKKENISNKNEVSCIIQTRCTTNF